MAKICPETNEPVLYIECLECEEKTCRRGNSSAPESLPRYVSENQGKRN